MTLVSDGAVYVTNRMTKVVAVIQFMYRSVHVVYAFCRQKHTKVATQHWIRRNRCFSACDSAFSYTFLHSVVCCLLRSCLDATVVC